MFCQKNYTAHYSKMVVISKAVKNLSDPETGITWPQQRLVTAFQLHKNDGGSCKWFTPPSDSALEAA